VRSRDGERRSRVCEDDGNLSGRRPAGHGRARRLPDERGNGRSGVPRGAARERRLDVPTQSSGAMTQISALCRDGVGTRGNETRKGWASRASARPFSSGGWNPRFSLCPDPSPGYSSAFHRQLGCPVSEWC
jgi:hypothetical protein